MKLPTFLIVGVQKAGTTSIYNYLKEHPQVYMSPIKETNFLEKDWEKAAPEILTKKGNGIYTFEKYCQLFAEVKDEVAIGEVSPNYLFHYKSSSECILRYLPNVQMLAILRNPVERAYSDYLMHVRDDISTDRSLSYHINRQNSSFTILKGFYSEHIEYFGNKFGHDRLKIYLYDDLCKDPVGLMQDIYRTIGVDDTFIPDISRKAQIAQVPKVKFLNTILRKQNPLRSLVAGGLKYVLPLDVRQNIRSRLININSQKTVPPLTPAERQQLVEIYREDILKLQELIQRDLSSWLR